MTDEQAHERASDSLMLPAKFCLRFTMKSDWRVGSGTGRPGNVDSLLQRDAEGLPYMPAKTVRGIWRDAAEQVAYGLDGGGNGRWADLVELIFGNQPARPGAPVEKKPNHSVINPSSAHYSPNLREHIKSWIEKIAVSKAASESDEKERAGELESVRRQLVRQLHAASTFIKPGVSVDPATGQARTDFLRFEEMGRKNAVLEADCTLSFDGLSDELKPYAIAFLLASARLVERVGGKRRRGAGLCQVEIVKAEETDALSSSDDAIAWLEEHLDEAKFSAAPEALENGQDEPPLVFDEASDTEGHKPPDKNEWWAVPLVLKLRKPLAVTARTLGNVSETLDYLPGTYLLSHITRTMLEKLGYDPRAAIAGGDIQVLPATIEVGGVRGLPVPHALFKYKSDGGFDRPQTMFNRLSEEEQEDTQLKGYREGYIGYVFGDANETKEQLPPYQTVHKSVGTHNTVEDEAQKPTEEVGGVYSWEAIAAGTVLRSELRLRVGVKAALDEKQAGWWNNLNSKESDELRLGSSRKDDYGLVQLAAEQPRAHSPKSQKGDDTLTVWLLSDLLLREPSLRATTDAKVLAKALAKLLGGELNVQLEVRGSSEERASSGGLLNLLVRARRIESWRVSWGLPRPSLLAMQAGSCVVFSVTEGKITDEQLQILEREGIGERRAEGYGQVRFNDPLTTERINAWRAAQKNKSDDVLTTQSKVLTADEEKIARQLEKEVWREQMRRGILGFAAKRENRGDKLGWKITGRGESEPPLSQLVSLREALSLLRGEADRHIVNNWLAHLKATENRKEKWKNGSLVKIEKLVNDTDDVWKLIEQKGVPCLTLTDGAEERLKKELWAEAVRGLIDASVRAHRRETEHKQV